MDKKTSGFIEAGLFVGCIVAIFLPFLTASAGYVSASANFFTEGVGKISLALAVAGAGLAFMKTQPNSNSAMDKAPLGCAGAIMAMCIISAITNMNEANTGIYRGIDASLSIGFYLILATMIGVIVLEVIGMTKGGATPAPVINGPVGNGPMGVPMGQPMGMPNQPMGQPMNNMQRPPMGQPVQSQPVGQPMNQPMPQQPPMQQPMNQAPMGGQAPMNNQQNNNFPNGQM